MRQDLPVCTDEYFRPQVRYAPPHRGAKRDETPKMQVPHLPAPTRPQNLLLSLLVCEFAAKADIPYKKKSDGEN